MQNGKARLAVFATLVVVLPAFVFSVAASAQPATPRVSGVYLKAADYKDGRLAFEGDCGSKTHKLNLHDFLHRPYIDVTHESEKRRYPKSGLFGFRVCDGRDFRFGANFEYEILESRELYIYAREVPVPSGKGYQFIREYYFSVGPQGQILTLTLENLKQALPDNHTFHDSLDATFGPGREASEFDEFHKIFTVNRLLIASREP